MNLRDTEISGVHVVEPELVRDSRGWLARTFDADWFVAHGLDAVVTQCSVSMNTLSGTLRGMHFQRPPNEEAKLVRCTLGAVFDVSLDLRSDSPTFRRWTAVRLSADNHLAVYIPPGVAHGFLTLSDNTELHYQVSAGYDPDSAQGVRWDDPAFAIAWPSAPRVLSDRDATYPDVKVDWGQP